MCIRDRFQPVRQMFVSYCFILGVRSTNTFLSQHQEAMLLYGVLRECFGFLKGPEDLYKLYSDRYNQSIQAFGLQQMGRRRRGEYDSGVPRIKIPSPSP